MNEFALLPSEVTVRSREAMVKRLKQKLIVNYYDTDIVDLVGKWKASKPKRFTPDGSELITLDAVKWYAQWHINAQKLVDYIVDTPEVVARVISNDSTAVTNSGFFFNVINDSHLRDCVGVSKDYFTRILGKYGVKLADQGPERYNSKDYVYWVIDNPKLKKSYWNNMETPALSRALWRSRYQRLSSISNGGMSVIITDDVIYIAVFHPSGGDTNATVARNVADIARVFASKLDSSIRAEELERQAQHLAEKAEVKRALHRDFLRDFWDKVKQQKASVVPDLEVAMAEWDTIPLHQAGVESSRTWGIEVETVHAERTSRPAGWESHSDGSLSSDDEGSCNCDCDYCYDSDHCEDGDNDCYYSGEGECREFVSPILNSFNSSGLRKLCQDLGDEENNSTPGIHVHVGAKDLTVSDVAHLLLAYGVVNRLIEPLYRRQTTHYCGETDGSTILWWLRKAREYRSLHNAMPKPSDIAYAQYDNSRYHDVNTQSLSKHNTLEFRAMGPFYNYDFLVRWAWFCREMVNVSRLHLPQRVWTSCNSVADVINVLRTYGSESPNLGVDEPINTPDLVLTEA